MSSGKQLEEHSADTRKLAHPGPLRVETSTANVQEAVVSKVKQQTISDTGNGYGQLSQPEMNRLGLLCVSPGLQRKKMSKEVLETVRLTEDIKEVQKNAISRLSSIDTGERNDSSDTKVEPPRQLKEEGDKPTDKEHAASSSSSSSPSSLPYMKPAKLSLRRKRVPAPLNLTSSTGPGSGPVRKDTANTRPNRISKPKVVYLGRVPSQSIHLRPGSGDPPAIIAPSQVYTQQYPSTYAYTGPPPVPTPTLLTAMNAAPYLPHPYPNTQANPSGSTYLYPFQYPHPYPYLFSYAYPNSIPSPQMYPYLNYRIQQPQFQTQLPQRYPPPFNGLYQVPTGRTATDGAEGSEDGDKGSNVSDVFTSPAHQSTNSKDNTKVSPSDSPQTVNAQEDNAQDNDERADLAITEDDENSQIKEQLLHEEAMGIPGGKNNNVQDDDDNDAVSDSVISGDIRLMKNVFRFEFPRYSAIVPSASSSDNSATVAATATASSNSSKSESGAKRATSLDKQMFLTICERIWDESKTLPP